MNVAPTQIKIEGRTLRISRVFKAPRARVYKAFTDADALAKWMPPHGFTGHVYKIEPRSGGTYRMSFSALDSGDTHYFGGRYIEVKPNERLHYTDVFEIDNADLQGEMKVTVTFNDVPGGTQVVIVQEGIPQAIPMEGAQGGWGQSLENLVRLVEQ